MPDTANVVINLATTLLASASRSWNGSTMRRCTLSWPPPADHTRGHTSRVWGPRP